MWTSCSWISRRLTRHHGPRMLWTPPCLPDVIAAFEAMVPCDAETLKAALVSVGGAHGLKLGKVQAPVRVAVTAAR